MARLRVPRHSATHALVYVWDQDPAWDDDRVVAELKEAIAARTRRAELEEAGEPVPEGELDDPDRHPVRVYFAGETRYDLGAAVPWGGQMVAPREYLNGEEVRWTIDRLNYAERIRVADLFRAVARTLESGGPGPGQGEVWKHCCRHGLLSVAGLDDLIFERSGGRVSESTMDAIMAVGDDLKPGAGTALIFGIGAAVWNASIGLTAAEKKR